VREEWRAAIKAGAPLDIEFRIRSASGAYRWFKTRSVPIRGSHGAIVKWYATSTDIDDLKGVEGNRRRSFDGLAPLLEAIGEPVFVVDGGKRITFLNAAAERALARKRGDLIGNNLFDAFPELRGSPFDVKLAQALRDRAPASFETRFGAASSESPHHVRVQPLVHPEGLVVLFQHDAAPPAAGRES
jgi:PAS domain-containing protein